MAAKLSDAKIQMLRTKDGRSVKAFDGRGLYLLVNPDGTRYWRFKYRFGKREKCISFGVYPEVSLNNARSQCDQARVLLRSGRDPSHERQVQKQLCLTKVDQAPREGDFETWFLVHHGARPGADRGTDHELHALVSNGKFAQMVLDQRRIWDEQHRSALQAWLASSRR